MSEINLNLLSESNKELLFSIYGDFTDALEETDKTIISNCVNGIAGNIKKLKSFSDQNYLEDIKDYFVKRAISNENEKKVDKINKLTQLIKTALENRR